MLFLAMLTELFVDLEEDFGTELCEIHVGQDLCVCGMISLVVEKETSENKTLPEMLNREDMLQCPKMMYFSTLLETIYW